MEKKRVVILGAGYAGVHAAKLLEKKFRKNRQALEITLIDKKPYHTLLTDLHEVAGSRLAIDAVKVNLNKIFAGREVRVALDDIREIDFEGNRLLSEDTVYPYDYLILATGSQPTFFGVSGAEENSFTLWSLKDAIEIRRHIEDLFEKAGGENDPVKRRELLTIAIAGGGFTGIELAGELGEWKKKLCRVHRIDEKEVRIVVIEAMPTILPILTEKLIKKAEKRLERLGIEVMTDTPIVQVEKDFIELKDGSKIKSSTLVWTAGVQATSFMCGLGLECGKRGRVKTNAYMESLDYENVYVIGDSTSYAEPAEGSKELPQIVETALQTAETAVHNLHAQIEGGQKKEHESNYHGFMVSIGGRYAVARLGGVAMSGFLAMAMKHLVNIHYLWGVGGFALIWTYAMHEIFHIEENRSILGGHFSYRGHNFWMVPLRLFLGGMWLLEGINKIKDGWLNPQNIFIVQVSDVSAASEWVEEGASSAAETVTALLDKPPAFFQSFMDTFIAPNAFIFQAMVVLMEIAIGLALLAGLFTMLAAAASVFLSLNFILSAMAGIDILWYIVAALAIIPGGGRTLGLDYYVMPWLGKWWRKTRLARKTYLYTEPVE